MSMILIVTANTDILNSKSLLITYGHKYVQTTSKLCEVIKINILTH